MVQPRDAHPDAPAYLETMRLIRLTLQLFAATALSSASLPVTACDGALIAGTCADPDQRSLTLASPQHADYATLARLPGIESLRLMRGDGAEVDWAALHAMPRPD